jgi:hypothetical protein
MVMLPKHLILDLNRPVYSVDTKTVVSVVLENYRY